MRPKNRGLGYLRRSTGKQEISLQKQLEWNVAAARHHAVAFDFAEADLADMLARGLHSYKSIRLDDGISGSDLTRPGFVSLNADALADPSVSHVFFYKRDRFARPDDAMQAAQIEKKLLFAGITVVHSDGVTLPIRRGEQSIMRDLELLLPYYQGGEELRKHAERVLGAQQELADGGYRVGGNAPYGFGRVLVNAAGDILEELPRGKTVKQAGCHVRAVPKFPEKIAVWLQMLEWKSKGWGWKRIANSLNDRGIPSPDAGRTRTDHGVKHFVSGKWSQNTVAELCRNPLIIGVQQYGKRSEGKIRRLGVEGSRLLEDEKDFSAEGKPRAILNDSSLRVRKPVGGAQFDPERWHAIQDGIEDRGKKQCGVPRAKDPGRYPLACRLVDLTEGCGSVLYGRKAQGRAVYTCGRYMRTDGAECASNQVDAEAILRFTLKTLKQFVEMHGRRDKLRRILLERARRQMQEPAIDVRAAEAARLATRKTEVKAELETIERRLAREPDDNLYAALVRQFESAQDELAKLDSAIREAEAVTSTVSPRGPEEQAEGALALLEDVIRITGNQEARADINPLLRRLGLRIGLNFQPVIKGKKRIVQRLTGGRLVFEDGALPVPLFGKDNVDVSSISHACPSLGAITAASEGGTGVNPSQSALSAHSADTMTQDACDTADEGMVPKPANRGKASRDQIDDSQPEGISITKVSRGDWI
jgi:DNA invertase Pin-like site-specific DNA recombinase